MIVEDFDDDTDLPLPARPLPNTGSRGALLQSVDSDEELDIDGDEADGASMPSHSPGHASPSQAGFGMPPRPSANDLPPSVPDITPYKKCGFLHPKHHLSLTRKFCSVGGHVFIQFTWTRSSHTARVRDASLERRRCGGLSAKTSPTRRRAWDSGRCTRSQRCIRATGRTPGACACSGRRMGGS